MAKRPVLQDFVVERDESRCVACQACVRMCSNDVHSYDPETNKVESDSAKCVGCHFCESFCPTKAINIKRSASQFRENANWQYRDIANLVKQAETGGVLLTGMGCDRPYPIYWDHILLNASQVTNPSIDPLREPMELRTYIGRRPDRIQWTVDSGQWTVDSKQKTIIQHPASSIQHPVSFEVRDPDNVLRDVLRLNKL